MTASTTGWTEGTVEIEGHRVFYRRSADVSDSLPIVHVHGFAISGSSLMPTARVLAARAANVVPDLPGHGKSDHWDGTLGIPDLADALVRILDALEMEKVVLVGNSMGCPVSLEVAHNRPDRVDRMVLVSPAGGEHNQGLARAIGQIALDGPRETPRMARVAVPDYVRFGPINTFRLFSELTRFPSLERIISSTVPTLAVIGSRDPLMPPLARVREVGRLAGENTTVALIEGAAHAINFSHPGELAHVIGSWLDGVEIVDNPDTPGLTRVLQIPRN